MKKSIALDIGGTKIAAGIVTESGELSHRMELKSDVTSRDNVNVSYYRRI